MYPYSLIAVTGTPNTTLSGYNRIDIDDLYNDNIARPKSPILGATNLPLILNPLLLSSKPLALNSGNVIADVLKQITLDTSNQLT